MKKTISSDYVKEIKDCMKQINEEMKLILEAERAQETVRNCRDYERANEEAKTANVNIMIQLEEMVRLASAMGCASGLYDIHKYHRIVEKDFREK